MGLLDDLFNRKKYDYAESQISYLENALKKAEKELKGEKDPEKLALYQKTKQLKAIVDKTYKDVKKVKDQKTFELKAHRVADMAMYAKTYLEHDNKQRWLYVFDERLREVKFARPKSEKDMEERSQILGKVVPELEKIVPESEGLLFHSTSISNAYSILENLSLSSSADRYDGYDASTDGVGRISVADISGLNWSTSYWLHTTTETMPCGVLFVLKEAYEGDFDKTQHQMDSIDFAKNPDQLEYVVSTTENMAVLKQALEEKGFTTDKVITFDQFLEIQQEKHKERQEGLATTEVKNDTMYIDQDKIFEEHALEQSKLESTIDTIDKNDPGKDER